MKKTLLLLAAAVLALCATVPPQAKAGGIPYCMPGETCTSVSVQ